MVYGRLFALKFFVGDFLTELWGFCWRSPMRKVRITDM